MRQSSTAAWEIVGMRGEFDRFPSQRTSADSNLAVRKARDELNRLRGLERGKENRR